MATTRTNSYVARHLSSTQGLGCARTVPVRASTRLKSARKFSTRHSATTKDNRAGYLNSFDRMQAFNKAEKGGRAKAPPIRRSRVVIYYAYVHSYQNVIEEVVVVDGGVEALRRVPPVGGRHECNSEVVVVGRRPAHFFPLRQDYQRTPGTPDQKKEGAHLSLLCCNFSKALCDYLRTTCSAKQEKKRTEAIDAKRPSSSLQRHFFCSSASGD